MNEPAADAELRGTAVDHYQVGFWWAGAQATIRTGATADQLDVRLGSQTQDTAVVNVASEGFTGWICKTFNFTATGASEELSFLASPAARRAWSGSTWWACAERSSWLSGRRPMNHP